MSATVFGLNAASYTPHELHRSERVWLETNCYVDLWIELLHTMRLDPVACMAFTLAMDFEGDQWTFFKPPPDDLERLFGIDIHEMQPYRSLSAQIAEQLEQGRTLIVEVDAWHLPDTAATSYRAEHVKTSVAAEAIDRTGERLRYFHNRSLHELAGDDYRGVFGEDAFRSPELLPPYAELVRFDAGVRLQGPELRAEARRLLARHRAARPAGNPFERFGERLARDLPELVQGDDANYHAYAFATVRMAGAAYELFMSHLEWLLGEEAARAVADLQEIVDGCATLSLKMARRRPFDPEPTLHGLMVAWERALSAVDAIV